MAREKLNGKEKAAILLVSLGTENASEIFKHLTEEEIEQITLEIANMRKVKSELKEQVMEEFHQMALAQDYISRGGVPYAREVLEKALGEQKAAGIIKRLTASLQIRPFDSLRKTDPGQLLNYIQNEHPQTIALILAYLDPDKSASIIASLPPQFQSEVARRIAIMDRTSPDIVKQVEGVLEKKLSAILQSEYTAAGGIESIVEILNNVDRGTEKKILDTLEEDNPELAEEIRKRMFVFEDIVKLDNRSVQRVIREIDNKELSLALKTASEEVAEKIYNNMSKRAAAMLKEDIEFMGPVRLREVEESQTKIVNEIRRLEEAGEIIIARGGEGDIVV